MRHVWSILCSKGIIDKASNNISLIETLEEIHVPAEIIGGREGGLEVIPAIPLNWVTLWTRSDPTKAEKNWTRNTIVSPSGKNLGGRE